MDTLRELIEVWLEVNDSSQAELARLSTVPQNVISRWLNGQVDRSPSPKNLKLVAPVLGLTYEDLLRRMGEIPPLEPRAEIDARRQAVRDQLDAWLTAVGPRYEAYFWQHLKAQGDSAVDLIRSLGTAVSETADGAVNGAVSRRAKRGRRRANDGDNPLVILKRHTAALLAERHPVSEWGFAR